MIDPFIDPDTLTLGELAVLEEYTGLTIAEMLAALNARMQAESATFLVACVYVAGKREDLGFTPQDANAIPFVTYAELDVDEEEVDQDYLPPEDEVDDGG